MAKVMLNPSVDAKKERKLSSIEKTLQGAGLTTSRTSGPDPERSYWNASRDGIKLAISYKYPSLDMKILDGSKEYIVNLSRLKTNIQKIIEAHGSSSLLPSKGGLASFDNSNNKPTPKGSSSSPVFGKLLFDSSSIKRMTVNASGVPGDKYIVIAVDELGRSVETIIPRKGAGYDGLVKSNLAKKQVKKVVVIDREKGVIIKQYYNNDQSTGVGKRLATKR